MAEFSIGTLTVLLGLHWTSSVFSTLHRASRVLQAIPPRSLSSIYINITTDGRLCTGNIAATASGILLIQTLLIQTLLIQLARIRAIVIQLESIQMYS